MWGHVWWAVVGWAAGRIIDGFMDFGPPEGALGGGGGTGVDTAAYPCHACVAHR